MMAKGLIKFGFIALVVLAAVYWFATDRVNIPVLNKQEFIKVEEVADESESLFTDIDQLLDSALEEAAFIKLISLKDSVFQTSGRMVKGDWYYRMAVVHKLRGSAKETFIHLDSALKYFVDHPQKLGEAYFLKGWTSFHLKKDISASELAFTHSVRYFSTAASIDYYRLSDAYYYLFLISVQSGELKSSKKYISKALNTYFEAEKYDPVRLGKFYVGQGYCFFSLNQYSQAMSAFEKALGIYATDAKRFSSNISVVEVNLGTVYMELGLSDKALSIYEKIRQQESPMVPLNTLYHNMGLAHERLGNFSTALAFFEKALNVVKAEEDADSQWEIMTIEIDRMEVLRKMGKYDMALGQINALIQNAAKPYSLEEILQEPAKGESLALDELQKALYLKGNIYVSKFEKSREDVSSLFLALETFEKSAQLGDILRLKFTWKDDLLAFNSILLSVDAQASGARSHYPQAVTCAYQLYEITQNNDYLKKAHVWMERKKIVAWWASLESSWNQYLNQIPEERKQLGDSLRAELEDIELEILQRKAEHEITTSFEAKEQILASALKKWKEELLRDYPGITSQLLKDEIVPLTTIQKSLKKEDPILLSYHWVNDTLMYVMVIGPNSSELLPIILPQDFTASLKEYQEVLQTPGLTTSEWVHYTSLSRKIYQSIIEPITKQVNLSNKRLLIIPDDELYQLSFGTLLTKEVNKQITTYKKLPYLVKTNPVGYGHSLTFWNWQMNQLSDKEKIESLGMAYSEAEGSFKLDNSLRETGWHELPATAKEIKVLANLLEGAFFTGEDATEAAFKQHAVSAQLIHLALHGSSADDLPRLMFRAGGKNGLSNEEDGILYLDELLHLQLRVKLAILNACESGKGIVTGGEVLSMARGFTYAGSENVVVNLWNTGDLPSWKLIEGFYEALDKGEPKDVSLQQTVTRYIAGEDELKCHPAFWGGLVSIGNMEPLDISSNSFTSSGTWTKLILLLLMITCAGAILRKYFQN